MQFAIPKIVRPIRLTEYAAEFVEGGSPVTVWVWVNPPRDRMREFLALFAERDEAKTIPAEGRDQAWADKWLDLGRRVCELLAELWSQKADPDTHWTVEQVGQLAANETDPMLYPWLVGETLRLITEHRAGVSKK